MINQHGNFVTVFSEMGSVIDFEFNESKVSNIYMKERSLGGSLSIDLKTYETTCSDKDFNYHKTIESTCYGFCSQPLPDSTMEESFRFEIANDSVFIRSGAEDYKRKCEELEKSNIIGEINKKEIGFALAESKDPMGNVWYFSAFPSTAHFNNFQFRINNDKTYQTWILGWVSSKDIIEK